MNFNTLKVAVRTEDTFISLRLELDVRFLQEINESEYLYKQPVELPGPSRAGRVMLNR
jgi:hypothetical protein